MKLNVLQIPHYNFQKYKIYIKLLQHHHFYYHLYNNLHFGMINLYNKQKNNHNNLHLKFQLHHI